MNMGQKVMDDMNSFRCETAANSEKVNPQSSLCSHPGSCHKRQKPQTPTPQAPIRNRQTRNVANAAKVLTAILTLHT